MLRAFAVTVFALAALTGLAFAPPAASADSTYEVQDGDTLLAVAVKIGVPTSQLLDWVASTVKLNALGDADSLKLGQVLKLPPSGPSAAASQTTSGATTVSKPSTASASTYAVQDGDTLLAIATKLGVPADKQAAWLAKVLTLNGLASAEQLAAGNTLQLPPDESQRTTQPALVSATSAAPSTVASVPVTSATSAVPSAPASAAASSASSTAGTLSGMATSYHESFVGKMMGCTGAGPYSATDLTIIAVGPAMHTQFPCGTKIEVCGPKGCLSGVRKDSCPGCKAYHVDLSRAGLTAVCGPNSCDVRLRRLP